MKKQLRDTLIILFITLFLFSVLEGIFRLSGIPPAAPVLTEGMIADPVLLWKTLPGSHGQKTSRFVPTISYVHNQNGFRMRQDIQPKKSNTFRVLMLGDSNLWGFGVEQAQTCASILQQLMDESNVTGETGKTVEIINMGVIGYSSYQGLKLFEQSMQMQPDLVILGYGYNDRRYTASNRQDNKTYFSQTYRSIQFHQFILELSSLCNWIAEWNQSQTETSLHEAQPRVPIEQYKQNFLSMLDICVQNNLPAVVLGLRDNPNFINRIEQAIFLEDNAQKVESVKLYLEIMSSPNLTESSLAPYLLMQLVNSANQEEREIFQELLAVDSLDEWISNLGKIRLPLDSMMGMTVIRPDHDYLAVLKEICSNYNQAQYIDLSQVMANLPDDEKQQCYFMADPCHISSRGHALLALHLVPVITRYMQQSQ